MSEKRLFHKQRRPSVSFMLDSEIFTGSILAFWDNGLEIQLDSSVHAEVGMVVCNLTLGDQDGCPVVSRLWIETLCQKDAASIIQVQCRNSQERADLAQALEFLLSPSQPANGKVDQSRIPRFSKKGHYTQKAVQKRLDWARAVSGSRLEYIDMSILRPESLAGNIENYIGAVQIPIGLAGPLLVKGTYIDGYVPLPIATTEGALVSSISRGAKACSLAGGIHVHVSRQHMVRAPVFFCQDLEGAVNLERWILGHLEEIREKAESVSSVARLERILPVILGNALHLRFYFSTGDAAGQNMTSACTWVACEWIADSIRDDPFIGYQWHNIEANMSGDKKANFQNFIEGRGLAVVAGCFVPGKVLRRILRVSPEQFVRVWSEAEFSAHYTGMMGSNINFANVIAGIFTATGQDIACVHESSSGIFKARKRDDGLMFSAILPSIVAGTVGGGTKLPVQRECLELMGCYGQGRLFRFAEIVGAACLALDISTGAAIVTNDFVSAHERLGRNRPTNRISWSEINEKFFSDLFQQPKVVVKRVKRMPRKSCSGIISTITSRSSGVHGLHRFLVTGQTSDGERRIPVFLKLKASSRELAEIGLKVAKLTGEDRLPGLYESQSHIFCLDDSHIRELKIYQDIDPRVLAYCPKIYGTMANPRREIYAVLMEDLTGSRYYDSIHRGGNWNRESIKTVLSDMAALHAVYFDRYQGLKEMNIYRLGKDFVCSASELLKELTQFNAMRYPELISPRIKEIYQAFLYDLEENIDRMLSFPQTLTHNDFNPRNLCLRKGNRQPSTVLYDWELAFFQNPQHDLLEFLIFVLKEGSPREEYLNYADFYLGRLQGILGKEFSRRHFLDVLDLNAVFFALVRMNLYLLGHNILKLGFLERVYKNLTAFIENSRHGSKPKAG